MEASGWNGQAVGDEATARTELTEPERERADGTKLEAKRERTEGTEPELSEIEVSEGTGPPLKRRWLLRRKKTIGRHKDGRKVKHGTYDYLGVRESHGLAPSAPPQQVLSAVMIDHDHRHSAIVPCKSELKRDLKKALACNLKHSETIKRLKNENHLQKVTISLRKAETKALVEERRQLRGEKRTLANEFKTKLKNVEDESSASKKSLIEENSSLYKSFSAEVRKLEERNNNNNIKIEQHQRKVVLLKEHNNDLAAALQVERSKSRLAIEQLLDDAEQVMMEAKGIEQAANATVQLARLNIHKERQYHASQITNSKSVS
jgi:hypothetical protein